ncbi:hypothetical protein Nepgr_012275 [Nepenthes gracilis]|uniref:GATA-type domain-containing protein n=1 Tax=Nepenthes gracilis TaxID=150966 RepID=A0AAD3SGQ4_NEPGR|nr:hypothetical protein Nepgr_012275 [Nepenthes gracilis]
MYESDSLRAKGPFPSNKALTVNALEKTSGIIERRTTAPHPDTTTRVFRTTGQFLRGLASFSGEQMNDGKKSCVDCTTTKTPLWRAGPTGPRTLCNACGIKYRKRKVGCGGQGSSHLKREKPSNSNSSRSSSSNRSTADANSITSVVDDKLTESLKMRLVDLGKEMIFQTTKSPVKRQRSNSSGRRKLGEVEEAAALLMSLSCGSVFA